jgi:hypothetical protein
LRFSIDWQHTQARTQAMLPDIRIAPENGFIRVTYKGDVEYDATNAMLRSVGQMAAQLRVGALLFDVREANYQFYHVGTIRHAEEGPALGIDRSFRIAFLGAADNPMLGYVEAVAQNRGYHVKAFSAEPDAIAWLRTGP